MKKDLKLSYKKATRNEVDPDNLKYNINREK